MSVMGGAQAVGHQSHVMSVEMKFGDHLWWTFKTYSALQ